MIWMCVSPQNLYIEILTPGVMAFGAGAFGKWLGNEGEALMSGISALEKETLESSLISFTMGGRCKKTAICELGGGFLPDTEFKRVLILDTAAFRVMKNKFVFL